MSRRFVYGEMVDAGQVGREMFLEVPDGMSPDPLLQLMIENEEAMAVEFELLYEQTHDNGDGGSQARADELYPEHAKLAKVAPHSQMIGEFLDYPNGLMLGEYRDVGYQEKQFVPTNKSIQDVLAEFFEIDQNKLELEKRAMLDSIRAGNGGL